MPALSIRDLDPKNERRLALAVVALAVLAIAWSLWRHLPPWFEPAPVNSIAGGAEAPGEPTAETARPLADYALFGAAPAGESNLPGEVVINAPETDLDLTLRGTLATEAPDQSLAIIGDGAGVEKSYRVGDELPGGAELHRVYRDRVILRRAGELEALKLREPERAAAASGGEAGPTAPAGPASATRRAEDRGLAETARELRGDPAELIRNFTAVPVQEDGRMVGVRLRATGDGGELLSRVGLRSSDVVTSVNGIPVNDMSRAGEIMNQLQSAGSFQLTVLRNGREQQVSVSLGQ